MSVFLFLFLFLLFDSCCACVVHYRGTGPLKTTMDVIDAAKVLLAIDFIERDNFNNNNSLLPLVTVIYM